MAKTFQIVFHFKRTVLELEVHSDVISSVLTFSEVINSAYANSFSSSPFLPNEP